MFSESTHLYDLIYSEFKDFQAEAGQVAALLRARCPRATRILDVGCGTGRHAAVLTDDHGFSVDGLDLESGFLDIARERCPRGNFFRGDMASFDLGRTYDAVVCLFSSVGYVRTLERLKLTFRSMFRHVNSEGILVIEPWFTPDRFTSGSLYLKSVDCDGLKIARMTRSEVRDRISWIEFHYLVGDPEEIRHLREVHELGLFTGDEMEAGLREAGFSRVEFDPEGLTGRGLYLAWPEGDG